MAKKQAKKRPRLRVEASKYHDRPAKKGSGTPRFKKGNPGKPKGATDRSPITRQQRASVKALIEELVLEHGDKIRKAIRQGLEAGPRHADRYLRLVTEYTDGKPVDTLNVNPWRQDEIETASRTLNKKFETILAAIRKRRDDTAGDSTVGATDHEPVGDGDR